ncbi:T9SS type A sorting domain-containing protein [uncultured Chryseobacterium sp.]|uniref:T9SS type A sorting domain-containing protein n=1 Tax=uncultured Chryseobacterium sp. TaxID=259322 RepID=UPI0027DCF1D9|nr:T9SS type A sorting domain-containing protein [uncultured Chryseobacterium sp.]
MRKLLFLVLLTVVHLTFAQILSYDSSFASNGKYTVTGSNNYYWNRIIQNSDNSIYFTYAKDNPSLGAPECVVSKLNANGTVDISFGNNGETIISNYFSGEQSELKKQTDGKILIMCFYSSGSAIVRLLPNGQLDTTFGINGIAKIDNIGTDYNSTGYGFYLQNNKIIVYGYAAPGPGIHYTSIYRLNNNGSIDTTFGNNGSFNTLGNFIFLDNQSNIISFISNNTNAYTYGALEKYNNNGQPFTSFGNNGVLAFTSNPGGVNSAFMDSNNNIVCSNINNEIFRIKPNGDHDNTFVFDSNSFPFNVIALSSIINEKNGNYYISGLTGSFGETFFISKITSTGAIDPIFNYYSETTGTPYFIGEMIINDNNIIAVKGVDKILKFMLNTSTLSVSNEAKTDVPFIVIENPVRQNLVYKSKEKIGKIDIYSIDGELLKTVRENNSNISELQKGVYIAKTTFENGKILTKKLIKN